MTQVGGYRIVGHAHMIRGRTPNDVHRYIRGDVNAAGRVIADEVAALAIGQTVSFPRMFVRGEDGPYIHVTAVSPERWAEIAWEDA